MITTCSDNTYQVVTINEVGTLIIWSIIQSELNNDNDLGVRPGAKLKMSQAAILHLHRTIEKYHFSFYNSYWYFLLCQIM